MIKAICDDEPPKAGPFFSKEFNEFIAVCLKKDPTARSSAKQLLTTAFIENNAASLKMSFSDLQMRRRSSGPKEHPFSQALNQAQAAVPAPAERSGEGEAKAVASPAKLKIDTNGSPDGHVAPPAPSPLTTRLTNAAIVRRTSKEFPPFDSPTNLMHKALTAEADRDRGAVATAAVAAGNGSSGLGNSAKITIREDVEEEEGQFIDGAQKAHDVIIAIRLEHLDRVLDRIAHKLSTSKRLGSSSFDYRGDEQESGGDGDGGGGEEEEYDDTQDHDIADVHRYTDEFIVKMDPMLEGHDSVDSMDKLLQFKHGEPSPVALQLPAHKFPRKADPVVEMSTADAKPVTRSGDGSSGTEAHLEGHKDDICDKAAVLEEKKGLESRLDEKHTHHSILKVICISHLSPPLSSIFM